MKLHFTFGLLFTAMLFTQCNGPKEVSATEASEIKQEMPVNTEVKEDNGIPSDVIIHRGYTPVEITNYNIERWTIEGDILSATVSYSGGCEEHKFELKTNGAYMKSMPPQLNVMLEHDNGGDMCRQMITETLQFNLVPIRSGEKGEVRVILNANRESIVSYTY